MANIIFKNVGINLGTVIVALLPLALESMGSIPVANLGTVIVIRIL